MSEIEVKKQVAYDIDDVWEGVRHFNMIDRIHPYVKSVKLLSEQNQGVGCERVCLFYNGTQIHEKAVEWNDDHYYQKINVLTPPGPITDNYLIINLVQNEEDVEITFATEYSVKYGLFGTILDKLVIKRKLTKMLEDVVDGFEQYLLQQELEKDD